jgi:hypothetical protein
MGVTDAASPLPLSALRTANLPLPLFRDLTTRPESELTVDHRKAMRRHLLISISADQKTWDADCEAAFSNTGGPDSAGLIRLRLAEHNWLIQVQCAQGAYQGSFWAVHLWQDRGGPHAAALQWQVPDQKAPDASISAAVQMRNEVVVWGDIEVHTAWRRSTSLVEIINRFRAIGDCGTRGRYRLRHGSTQMVELAAIFRCPESLSGTVGGPDTWPLQTPFNR